MAKTVKSPKLDAIINRVGLPYFLMSVSHLLDVGYRVMTPDNVAATVEEIKQQDDSSSIMKNEFSIFIVETAFEISQELTPLDLIKYAAKLMR